MATIEQAAQRIIEKTAEHAVYNAYINMDPSLVLAQARSLDQKLANNAVTGPLTGMFVAVKDNIHVKGLPNTVGTESLRDFVPTQDATAIASLRNAGAIIVGKANMHELAYGITSNNATFGAVANALDATLFAGGSSGGTAVAVALGMATVGLGTDTGGSVRIPAALNGLVGFRPSVNRYPKNGLATISSTRDTIGPITKSVNDAILLDQVLADSQNTLADIPPKDIRLGVPRAYFYDDLEDCVDSAMQTSLSRLEQAGITLVYEDIPNIAKLNELVSMPVVLYETLKDFSSYLEAYVPTLSFADVCKKVQSPDVAQILDAVISGAISTEVYESAISQHRVELQHQYAAYFAKHQVDGVVFPTVPLSARPIVNSLDTVELGHQQVPTFGTYIRNTDPSSNAGIPGLSLPISASPNVMSINLSVGIEIDGPAESDEKLLAIGRTVEQLLSK